MATTIKMCSLLPYVCYTDTFKEVADCAGCCRVVLHCPFYPNVRKMHKKLSWLMVDAKLQASLQMFMHGEPMFFFEEKLLFKSFCHSYLTH